MCAKFHQISRWYKLKCLNILNGFHIDFGILNFVMNEWFGIKHHSSLKAAIANSKPKKGCFYAKLRIMAHTKLDRVSAMLCCCDFCVGELETRSNPPSLLLLSSH